MKNKQTKRKKTHEAVSSIRDENYRSFRDQGTTWQFPPSTSLTCWACVCKNAGTRTKFIFPSGRIMTSHFANLPWGWSDWHVPGISSSACLQGISSQTWCNSFIKAEKKEGSSQDASTGLCHPPAMSTGPIVLHACVQQDVLLRLGREHRHGHPSRSSAEEVIIATVLITSTVTADNKVAPGTVWKVCCPFRHLGYTIQHLLCVAMG